MEKGISIPMVNIVDVAPTVLHFLGESIPTSMDGKLITKLFKNQESIGERYYEENTSIEQMENLSDEEAVLVLHTLRKLGYKL